MRARVLVLVGLVWWTACSGEPTATTPTTLRSATTTTAPENLGPIRGALPDGVIYDIGFSEPRDEQVVAVEAPLSIELDGSELPLQVNVRRVAGGQADLTITAGDWVVEIDFPASADQETRNTVADAIEVSIELEMPVFTLNAPLRWSEAPQVSYETFLVRSGCPSDAAVCNPTHAVSVLPQHGDFPDSAIWVETYALRPQSDRNYLPPGPLIARWHPDVFWTGDEMIVWGGSRHEGGSQLLDGAAFDPASNEWRLLPDPPLKADQPTRAVWTGTEMVVIGEEATVSWDPSTGEWRVVADGIAPPLDPGMTVAFGSQIVIWTSDGLHILSDGREWAAMPDPGLGEPGILRGSVLKGSVLRMVESRLLAIGQDECDRLVSAWEGDGWSEAIRISLDATLPACGHPNQTGVANGTLILWDDTSGVVASFDPDSESVNRLPPIPLPAMEHAPGPLQLDGDILVTAGLDGAVFDRSTERWFTLELPGLGTDLDMVWTGEEVLMWDRCCYGPDDIDAWRWTPPNLGN